MNLLEPTRLRALAREHALGTLRGGARRRFDRLLRESPEARAELARWQEELATLAAAVPPLQPRAEVWQELSQRLGMQRPADGPAAPARPASPASPAGSGGGRSRAGQWLLSGGAWAALLAGLLVGLVLGTFVLQTRPAGPALELLRDELPASYVGLLSDAGGKPAALLSSLRHGRALTAKMLMPVSPPAGQVGLLWAFPRNGAAPFLVGALPVQGSGQLPLGDSAEKLFFNVDRLGVSFEAAGSAPAGPTGPLVVSGPCVKLW